MIAHILQEHEKKDVNLTTYAAQTNPINVDSNEKKMEETQKGHFK